MSNRRGVDFEGQNIDFLGVETGVHALLSTFGGFGWGLRKSYAFSLSNLGSFLRVSSIEGRKSSNLGVF